ncbi:MAG TPA: hypothetical protein VKA57_04605 [Solirubrobacteraceae bacterium]|nr:hypothetical protein [Solirubrobacteraceae bacterium]
MEAARNVAFSLIANSIRDAYLQRRDLFRAIVERRAELGCAAVASAIEAGDVAIAREAMTKLARAQEQRLLETVA